MRKQEMEEYWTGIAWAFMKECQARMERELEELTETYPIAELIVVNGNLPEGIKPLREFYCTTNEGHIFGRQWIVFAADVQHLMPSVPRETLEENHEAIPGE